MPSIVYSGTNVFMQKLFTCFPANSVVQCLLNVPLFVELIEDITESHKSGVCNLCKTLGMQG